MRRWLEEGEKDRWVDEEVGRLRTEEEKARREQVMRSRLDDKEEQD
jgi:hypothetical protein